MLSINSSLSHLEDQRRRSYPVSLQGKSSLLLTGNVAACSQMPLLQQCVLEKGVQSHLKVSAAPALEFAPR